MTCRSNDETYTLGIYYERWNWNPTFIWTMRCKWKPNHVLVLRVFSMLSVLGFGVVLECWPVIGRVPEAQGLWYVIACWCYLVSIFYNPTMVMWWYALWDVYIDVHDCSSVWSWVACVWDTWLNHFWVIDQLYLNYFPVAMMGLKCEFILDDVMLWHVLTWPFLAVFD